MIGLSQQEERILRLRARGLTAKAVARAMEISEQTVKNHMTSVYVKLDADNLPMALAHIGWIVVPGESAEARSQCSFVGQCGRPSGHRGHHGGFREAAQ